MVSSSDGRYGIVVKKLMNDSPLESEELHLRWNAERERTRLETAAVN